MDPPDAPPVSIPVGITIGLLASFVQSLGLTMQRKSHVLNDRQPEHERCVEHRRPLWLLGFGIFISSNILGSLFQIASLPVVILAPLGAVSLLWNAFFARLLLGDVFSPYMIFGTLAIAGGAVLIAIFGIVPEPTHSLESLLILFARKTFIVYFSLLGAAVLGCLIVTHIAEYSLRHKLASPPETPPKTPPLPPFPLSPPPQSLSMLSPTVPAATATERTPLLDPKPYGLVPFPPSPPPAIVRTRLLLAVSYASVSGILSGMCLLFAKSGVELLILTAKGDNQFWRWEAWALLVGLVVFALLQLWYLHKSLVLADPTIVCPLAFCFYNLSSIVNGLVYFDQFSALTTLHLCLVILGIVVLLGGVWTVSVTSGGDGGVEPGTWHEGEEVVMSEEEAAMSAMSPDASDVRRGRNASLPASPLPDPLSPGSTSESLHVSPSRKRLRHQRYSTLLGSEGQGGPPLGGLSIGLSAASPGFALRPARRGSRRESFSGVVSDARMRRTVSEADMGAEGSSQRARARWKWVRDVWRARRGESIEESV